MAVTECFHRRQIERIAEGMGNHYGFGLLGVRLLQHRHIDIILRNRHIHEYRHSAVLDERRHRGRKTGGHCNNLITALHPAFAKKRRRQCHKGHKVRGRTGIHQRTVLHTQISGQLLFKFIRIPAGGQPELQGTVYQIHHLISVIHAGRVGNPVSRLKWLLFIMVGIAVSSHHVQDLLSRFLFCLIFKHGIFPL